MRSYCCILNMIFNSPKNFKSGPCAVVSALNEWMQVLVGSQLCLVLSGLVILWGRGALRYAACEEFSVCVPL